MDYAKGKKDLYGLATERQRAEPILQRAGTALASSLLLEKKFSQESTPALNRVAGGPSDENKRNHRTGFVEAILTDTGQAKAPKNIYSSEVFESHGHFRHRDEETVKFG